MTMNPNNQIMHECKNCGCQNVVSDGSGEWRHYLYLDNYNSVDCASRCGCMKPQAKGGLN